MQYNRYRNVTKGSNSWTAFHAAQDDGEVSMPIVLDVARTEFKKMERPINEAEFRWRGPEGVVA